MVSISPEMSQEEIRQELAEQARALWGNERADELRSALETTASQLHEVGRVLPRAEVEPGFYQ